MQVIRSAQISDILGITLIYNESVISSTATFDTQPRTDAEQQKWFAAHGDPTHPILVAEEDGAILGWASLSAYSDRCAYSGTAEISVYVDKLHRGKGIGRKLMDAVLAHGRQAGLHSVLARIVAGNDVSIRLHESIGFQHVGILREVGCKFGRLLDVYILQIIFPKESASK